MTYTKIKIPENSFDEPIIQSTSAISPKQIVPPTVESTVESTDDSQIIRVAAYIATLGSDQLRYTYRLSKTVRILAIIDLAFSLFTLLFGQFGLYLIIKFICAINGYLGAKYYNTISSIIYFIYLAFGSIAELMCISLLDHHNNTQYIVGIFVQILLFILKAYIARFVYIFYKHISDITDKNIDELINYENTPVKLIYW